MIGKFTDFYGFAPEAAAQAPGRLEVLGNHTDYSEGFVISCAVSQQITFALKRCAGSVCKVVDFRTGEVMEFDLAALDAPPPRSGAKYIIGMMNEMRKRNWQPVAFNGALESTVPLSAGMSSSAALEMSCGLALGKATGFELEKPEWARTGQGVENNFLGLKTGLLDQFSSLYGQENALIMSDFRTVEVTKTLPLPPGYVFVVVNSMKKHDLVDSDYNARREDCESAAAKLAAAYKGVKTLRDVTSEMLAESKNLLTLREFRRASHVVGECERVQQAAETLAKSDIDAFGKLLFASHASSRENFENSTPELDCLVELAATLGSRGARLSGGGFGGITIHLVEEAAAELYAQRIAVAYESRTGIVPETFICAPSAGAQVLNCAD